MTVLQLLTASLRRIRVVSGSDTPDGDTLQTAFDRFNDWIDDLKNEGLLVYARTRTTWTLTTAASYAVGTGAAVNVERPGSPQQIENCGYIDTSFSPSYEYLLGVPLTEDARAGIPQKAFQSLYPQYWYYNPTLPTGTLSPWPIPTSSTLQGVIYTGQSVDEVASTATTLSLPQGYRRFLVNGLAVELHPEFPIAPLNPEVLRIAMESKGNLKRTNQRIWDIATPMASGLFGGPPEGNIYTGP